MKGSLSIFMLWRTWLCVFKALKCGNQNLDLGSKVGELRPLGKPLNLDLSFLISWMTVVSLWTFPTPEWGDFFLTCRRKEGGGYPSLSTRTFHALSTKLLTCFGSSILTPTPLGYYYYVPIKDRDTKTTGGWMVGLRSQSEWQSRRMHVGSPALEPELWTIPHAEKIIIYTLQFCLSNLPI